GAINDLKRFTHRTRQFPSTNARISLTLIIRTLIEEASFEETWKHHCSGKDGRRGHRAFACGRTVLKRESGTVRKEFVARHHPSSFNGGRCRARDRSRVGFNRRHARRPVQSRRRRGDFLISDSEPREDLSRSPNDGWQGVHDLLQTLSTDDSRGPGSGSRFQAMPGRTREEPLLFRKQRRHRVSIAALERPTRDNYLSTLERRSAKSGCQHRVRLLSQPRNGLLTTDYGVIMKLALIGYGKMGRMIEQAAARDAIEIVCVLDPVEGSRGSLSDADVCVDFTEPSVVIDNIKSALAAGVSIVVGTTGWYDRLDEAKQLVHESGIGLVYGSNFSI